MRCRFCDSLPIPSLLIPSISTINKSNDCWMSYVDVLKWPEIYKFFRYFHRFLIVFWIWESTTFFVFRLQAISDVYFNSHRRLYLEVFCLDCVFPECLMCAMCDGNGQADRVWWDLLSVDYKSFDHESNGSFELQPVFFPMRWVMFCLVFWFIISSSLFFKTRNLNKLNKCPLPITEWYEYHLMTSYHAAFVCFFRFWSNRSSLFLFCLFPLSLSLCICCRSWIPFFFFIFIISSDLRVIFPL